MMLLKIILTICVIGNCGIAGVCLGALIMEALSIFKRKDKKMTIDEIKERLANIIEIIDESCCNIDAYNAITQLYDDIDAEGLI